MKLPFLYSCRLPRLILDAQGWYVARRGGVVRNGICVAPGPPHQVAGIASVSTQPRCCSAASSSAHASSVSSRASAATEHALRRRSTRAEPYTLPTTHAPRVNSTENSNFGYVAPVPGKRIRGSFAPANSSIWRPDLIVDEEVQFFYV